MKIKQWEKTLLEFYQNNYNAKWMRVYNNKHPVLPTKVFFYTTFKRKIKKQPYCGELTFTGMFKNLKQGDWYNISNLLETYRKEEKN